MSTTTNKRSVMVGIFVFLGIVIFVAGIFILGGQQKRFEKSIRVNTVFDNIAGLKVGNNVWFSGVKIGTVKQIKFYGQSQVEITMNIVEDAKQYIRKDALARLSSESLIGNKIIEIYGGSQQVPSVEDGDKIQSASALSTDDIMATLQENNKNLVTITSNFKVLSSKLVNGEGMAGTLLTDTTLATDFRTMVASLQQTSANAVRVTRSLSQFSSKLNAPGGLANNLVTDTVVFNKLQASMEQLQQTTASAAEMTNNLKQTSSKLNEDNNALGVMLNDPEFAARMKNTMVNLQTSTEKLDDNMEALQHNFLLRGFFKKKAKSEAKQAAYGQKQDSTQTQESK
jgi:phospholipid/cholesterol/gamma-HCH transport system substrate-binding protein